MNAWEFVDALLEESVRKNEPCSFPPAQCKKLREMIAEGTLEQDGRKRKRAPRREGASPARTIRVPDDLFAKLEADAARQGISYSALIIEVCEDYVERTDQ